MERIIITLFVLLSTFSSFSEGVREDYAQNKVYKIGISKLLAHPALDAIEEGIKDYLDSTGYAFEYDVQNANGEVTAASQIAQVFKDEGTDLNIGIATPTAQALANVCVDTPLIYSSVTDPTAAGLVGKGMENIAGVSDMVPVAAHLSLIMQIVPELESLGMVYTSGEANGIVLMEAMNAAAEDEGVDLITASVANSSEVRMAAESIIDRVDAVYVATDNTVISAITALSDVCMAHRIPLFSADTTSSYGTDVLLAGGFDYYAPQSFLDENGNRTMIAWMNRWLWMPYGEDHGPTTGEGWRCALSLPRSVRLMNGQLEFSPIAGLCNIFKRRNKLTAEIDRSNPLMLTREAAMRISVEFTEEEIPSAVLNIAITSKSSLLVDLLSRKAILITGGKSKGVIVAELANTQKHRLEIILDKTAYEIFIDDGYDVISVEIYEDYNDIELSVPYKKAVVNVTTEY